MSPFKLNQRLCSLLLITIFTLSHFTTQTSTLNFGELIKGDKRFLYPSLINQLRPFSSDLPPEIYAELNTEFYRNHDPKCKKPTRGVFGKRVVAYFLCGKNIQTSDPTKDGLRTIQKMDNGLSEPEVVAFGFSQENRMVFVKAAASGSFEFYSSQILLGKVTGSSKIWESHKKSLKLVPAPAQAQVEEVYMYAEPTFDEQSQGKDPNNLELIKFDTKNKKSQIIDLSKISALKGISSIQNVQVSEKFITFGCLFTKSLYKCSCVTEANSKHQFEKCTKEGNPLEKGRTLFYYQLTNTAFEIIIREDSKVDITTRPNGKQISAQYPKVENAEIEKIMMDSEKVMLAWKASTGKIVEIWSIETVENKIMKTEIKKLEIEDLVFLLPDVVLEIRGQFEVVHKSVNYVFDSEKLSQRSGSQKTLDVKLIKDNKIFTQKIELKVAKITDISFTEESSKTVLEAEKGSLVDFEILEENLRGNVLNFSMEKEKGITLTRENKFEITQENSKEDKLEFLDDLYAQSFTKTQYTIHKCQLNIGVKISAGCARADTIEVGEGRLLTQTNSLTEIYSIFKMGGAKLRLVRFNKLNGKLSKAENDLDLGELGEPELAAMGVLRGDPQLLLAFKSVIKFIYLKTGGFDYSQEKVIKIEDKLPSAGGKACSPLTMSMFPFGEHGKDVKLRAYATYNCAGNDILVRIEGPTIIKEIITYKENEQLSCSTEGGVLLASIKANTEPTLKIRRETYPELINYEPKAFGLAKVKKLNCENPNLSHAVLIGENDQGASLAFLVSTTDMDPLKLLPAKINLPDKFEKLKMARSRDRIIFSIRAADGEMTYRVLSLEKVKLVVSVEENGGNKFIASRDGNGKRFELDFDIKIRQPAKTEISPKKKINFYKGGRYNLEDAIDFKGPISGLKMKLPASLAASVSFGDRISFKKTNTMTLPASQREFSLYKEEFLILRSNGHETQIDQIKSGGINKIAYIAMPCMRMDYSRLNNENAALVISCPFYKDVIIPLSFDSKRNLSELKQLHFWQSRDAKIDYYAPGRALLAGAVRFNGRNLQVRISKLSWSPGVGKELKILSNYFVQKGKIVIRFSWPLFGNRSRRLGIGRGHKNFQRRNYSFLSFEEWG